MLVAAWHVLHTGQTYADYFARRDADPTRKRLIAQLEPLGYDVTVVAERRCFVKLRATVGDGGELGEIPGRRAGEAEGVDRDQPMGGGSHCGMEVRVEVCPLAAMSGRGSCERGRQSFVAVLDLR
jgi:hypothetical protein